MFARMILQFSDNDTRKNVRSVVFLLGASPILPQSIPNQEESFGVVWANLIYNDPKTLTRWSTTTRSRQRRREVCSCLVWAGVFCQINDSSTYQSRKPTGEHIFTHLAMALEVGWHSATLWISEAKLCWGELMWKTICTLRNDQTEIPTVFFFSLCVWTNDRMCLILFCDWPVSLGTL